LLHNLHCLIDLKFFAVLMTRGFFTALFIFRDPDLWPQAVREYSLNHILHRVALQKYSKRVV
jgi:hypothetical protein